MHNPGPISTMNINVLRTGGLRAGRKAAGDGPWKTIRLKISFAAEEARVSLGIILRRNPASRWERFPDERLEAPSRSLRASWIFPGSFMYPWMR